jgi:nucleotide-binding universal stress UspA family protein
MKLLVPIDFSDNARSALDYAASLAMTLHADLHVIHVIRPFSPQSAFMTTERDEVRKNVIFEMHSVQQHLQDDYDIPCSCDITLGEVADEIVRVAGEKKVDMIVMGTHGASGFHKILLGSNTTAVVERCDIPVLAIPEKAAFIPPSRIVFATDYNASDVDDLVEIARFAKHFNAEIFAVHVVNRFEEDEDNLDFQVVDYFTEIVRKRIPNSQVRCEEFQYSDVAEGIRNFIHEEDADILAVSVSHKTVLERLLRKSVTREFLFNIDIPLLIFRIKPETESSFDFL